MRIIKMYAGMLFAFLLTTSCSEDDNTSGKGPDPVVVTTEFSVAGLAGQAVTVEAADGTTNDIVFDAEGKSKIEVLKTDESKLPVYTTLKIADKSIRLGRQAGTPIVFDYENGKVAQRTNSDGSVIIGIVDEFAAIMADAETDPDMLAKAYTQEADLYFNGVTDWQPIGASFSAPFTGTYDGNGFNIHNFYLAPEAPEGQQLQYIGLFGITRDAVLKNITIASGEIKGFRYTAAIVARVQNNTSEVINCHNYASVTGEETETGGIVASAMSGVTIKDCTNHGLIHGKSTIGGIASSSNGNANITNCTNYGDIICTTGGAGGIIGNSQGMVVECSNEGNVEGATSVGGIAGQASGYNMQLNKCTNKGGVKVHINGGGGIAGNVGMGVTVLESTNEGTVMADPQTNEDETQTYVEAIGGIAGMVSQGGNIKSCVNTADAVIVAGTTMSVGRIAGYVRNGEVTDCINKNNISSQGVNTGGIAGFNAGNIYSCTNEGSVSGKNFVGGIVGFNEEGYGKVRFGLNNGNVNGTDGFVGGIAGSSYGTISASRNNAAITGTTVTGGITGGMAAYGYVLACANYGKVKGTDNVGGLVGEMRQSGLIEASFSVGNVSGNTNIAGICGVMTDMSGECGVSASYWSGNCQKGVAVGTDAPMDVYYFDDGTTAPQGVTTGWPSETQNKNWGVSEDGTNSKWWKNLGTKGKAEYPKLWWEA